MTDLNLATTRFRLHLFGGPQLLVGGDPCPLSPLEGRFLGLLYGTEGDGLDREEIISLLWPENAPPKARACLSQVLYTIKKKTGTPPPFTRRGDRILKSEMQVTSDLDSHVADLRALRLSKCAARLSRGFLRKANSEGPRRFSDWIEARERDLKSVLGSKLRAQLRRCESTAEWTGAKEAAESISALHPLDEGALRVLMKALARASGFPDAEAALNEFAKRKEAALGSPWTPRDETLSLLERLRSHSDAVGPGHLPESPEDPKEPRLIGRDRERTLLRRKLIDPPHRALRGILITGEAGIGKTRLIREAVLGLDLEGQTVYSGRQAELEQLIPLNPLIEALREPRIQDVLSHLDEPWRAVLYGVMPTHYRGEGKVPQAPQIQQGSVPRRLFEAFHQLFLGLVTQAPVVLVVDDLQWADDTTLSVLDFLFRRWDQGRLQAVFSLRSQEIRSTSALRSFLDTLRVHDDFLEVPLGDLSETASRTLIEDISGRDLSETELARLYSLAGGNPFFLIELTLEHLAGRVEEPSLPDGLLSIPLSIRQVLQRRFSQLSSAAARTLGVLSVHSKPLRIEDLAKVAGLTITECVAGLDQLHEFRLVKSSGFEISVGHELIRRTHYQSLSASRRAWLHLGLARHLQESTDNPPVDELAIHFHHGSAAEEARNFAREAAERAEKSGAIPEALRFLGIAREHTNDPEAVAEIVGRMGHLNYRHHNLKAAAPLLEVAAHRFRRQGREGKALEADLERVDSLGQTDLLPLRECLEELERIKNEAQEGEYWETFMKALEVEARIQELRGNLQGIRQILAQAQSHETAGGPEAHCRAQALLALNTYFGSAGLGLRAARRAVTIAKRAPSEKALLHALNRLIIALHYQGRLDLPEGHAALAEAEKRLGTCGDLILKFFIRLNPAVWLLESGQLEKAVPAFDIVEHVIQGNKEPKPLAMLNLNLGELHLDGHEIDRARERYGKALSYLSPACPPYYRTIINAGLGLCALQDGSLQEARSREGSLAPDPDFWTFDPTLVTIFRARMMIRRGDGTGAVNHISRVRRAVKGRFFSAWIRLLLEEARVRRRFTKTPLKEDIDEAIEACRQSELERRRRELCSLVVNHVE